jgi:hypothetical protein
MRRLAAASVTRMMLHNCKPELVAVRLATASRVSTTSAGTAFSENARMERWDSCFWIVSFIEI